MTQNNLFRSEALAHVKNKNYGTVFINTPVHFIVLTAGCGLLVLFIILFVMFAEFSDKCIVTGFLNATNGIVRVYPKQQGVIVKSHIKQGDIVHQGEPLFLIDTSYDGLNTSHRPDVVDKLQTKVHAIDQEISEKTARLKLLEPLLQKKYMSLVAYQAKQDELLALEQKKNAVDIELIKDKQSRSYIVRSPINGLISSTMVKLGQAALASKPLVNILPNKVDLIAEIYVPVSKSGFLNQTSHVILRYDAYPYQRFGTTDATIIDISQNTLTDADEDKPLRIGQPYYKATARLNKQGSRSDPHP